MPARSLNFMVLNITVTSFLKICCAVPFSCSCLTTYAVILIQGRNLVNFFFTVFSKRIFSRCSFSVPEKNNKISVTNDPLLRLTDEDRQGGREVHSSVDIEKLYHTYYMDVYSYMMTLAKDAHMAEEITQEVFFKALKTRHPCNGASGELTWLCAIAKNTFMDECRRQARLRKTDEELPDETSLEKRLEDETLTLQIHQILHRLEEPYKEVFQLRIFGELSFQKIGQIFEKTEVWARVTYHRARLKIQERMEEHDNKI